jgi:hypothetical protein
LVLAADEDRMRGPITGTKVSLPFRFTGDGLPALAGLLTSGIIEVTKHYSGVNSWGSSMPSFEVRLTQKGLRLVAAWQVGDALFNSADDKAEGEA